ncbi:hypothetical protein D9758_005766 [Tetrapyrgos nigripes]|uniref:Uncharacterized protein n=1 Tax=Tetrapyrgos nigripes TaxID=182062 RepID=A0A8H5GK43_9AGAR|nr:hypothetical protein D9758_005766 [Tetrapyrgos nigripes]
MPLHILDFLKPKSFFGCFPLRFGVIALSFIIMVGASIVTVTGWSQIAQLSDHPISTSNDVALYFHSITFTILAVLGLFGVLSASFQNRPMSFAYMIILPFLVILSFSSGAFVLNTIFHPKSERDITRCLNGATDELTRQVCRNGIAIIKGVAIAIYIGSWVLELYTSIIAYGYYSQLSTAALMDEANNETFEAVVAASGPSTTGATSAKTKFPAVNGPLRPEDISGPTPLTMYNSAGAPGINSGYAFSTVDASFGAGVKGGRQMIQFQPQKFERNLV